METFKELVRSARSCRGYDESRAVTREELLELTDCARLAPSGRNRQPLKYRLVYTREERDAVLPLTRWAAALPQLHLPRPGKAPAAFIVICLDTAICGGDDLGRTDIGIAAQTILLAAAEAGLGGCMIGSFDPSAVARALGLDGRFVPALLIALGKPDEKIVLTEIAEGESTRYYRDENDVHFVPKRRLEDIVL